MAARDYNKADVSALGDAIDGVINAILDDGIGMDDVDEAITLLTAAALAVNEIKDVPAAAGLHVASRVTDKQGDRLLAKAIADEASE